MKKQEEEGSEMSYSYEENELHECCAVDCGEPGTELLVIKSWSTDRYGGKDQQDKTHHPVASGYYCKNHMTKKLRLLAKRYGSSSSSGGGGNNNTISETTTAVTDVNLAATAPKQ